MKPTLQTSRQVATTILTAIGVGLFIAVSVRAVHQISDRQYTDGKQRIVSAAPVPPMTTNSAATSTVRYATNLTPLLVSSPSHADTVSAASSFTPRKITSAVDSRDNHYDTPKAKTAKTAADD